MPSLILIDLSILLRANWHASANDELSATYDRTVAQVTKLAGECDYCAVCLDSPPYKRKELSPEYKAHRDKAEPLMLEQFRKVEERLRADGLLLWSSPGYEADDVIASATHWAERQDPPVEVCIASSDKDLMQLVDDGVRVLSPRTGDLYGKAEVLAKFGVLPTQIHDWLTLMGDKSDNIAGVPGCGAKRAADMLSEFGSLDRIQRAADGEDPDGRELKPAMEKAIQESRETIALASKLVRLHGDVPLNFEELYEERTPEPLAEPPTEAELDELDEDEDPDSTRVTLTDKGREATTSEGGAAKSTTGNSPLPAASSSKAIVPSNGQPWDRALEPANSKGAVLLSRCLYNSRLFPQFGNEDAILAVILRGRSLGMDSVTALSTFHVIEGRPTMHASLIVGLVLRSGLAEYFTCVKTTDAEAWWVTKRKGNPHEVEFSYTIHEAEQAGLLKPSRSGKPSNWMTRPKTMLRWRGATELARMEYPDVTTGLYTPDEVSNGEHDVQVIEVRDEPR